MEPRILARGPVEAKHSTPATVACALDLLRLRHFFPCVGAPTASSNAFILHSTTPTFLFILLSLSINTLRSLGPHSSPIYFQEIDQAHVSSPAVPLPSTSPPLPLLHHHIPVYFTLLPQSIDTMGLPVREISPDTMPATLAPAAQQNGDRSNGTRTPAPYSANDNIRRFDAPSGVGSPLQDVLFHNKTRCFV